MLDWTHEDKDDALTPVNDEGQALHVLIPASHGGPNLCKATMGLNVLGYPEPILLAWNKQYTPETAQLGPKITEALAYVSTLENDDDLVVMADAYDSWFQLPPAALRSRYFKLISSASYRMRRRLGRRAVRREAMKQTIVFGAAKACTPNELASVACYPVPEATTPRDMYGAATDTIIGPTKKTSFRPRYLDAGFMMGPVGDVRRMLQRAQEMLDELPSSPALDVNRGANEIWGGDAQGIFARIFGEQAFQREIIRQRYRSWFKKWSLPHTPGKIEMHEFKDITNPDFTHEILKPMKGHPREFGISLDFAGSLVSNMADADGDHRNMILDGRPQNEFDQSFEPRGVFECGVKIPSTVPKDLENVAIPDPMEHADSWSKLKLFGNLCLGNIPVMLHLNGEVGKGLRVNAWNDIWWHWRLHQRLEATKSPAGRGPGAWDGNKEYLGWEKLCPRETDGEIFRDQ